MRDLRPDFLSAAFSPGHITGILEKPLAISTYNNYNKVGSKGVGFCIDIGVTTVVKVFSNKDFHYDISINGRVALIDLQVSKWVINYYIHLLQKRSTQTQRYTAENPCYIEVHHIVDVPIGFGLGSSGAAALSLSYALNEALNTQLTNIECAQIAHVAEIVCKTGLGTVLAEFVGGFEIRTGLGGPGIGKIEKIPLAGYKAIILCISPISTHSILSDYSKSWINSIDGLGTRMLNQLRKSKDVGDFLKMSYDFSSALNLTQGPCKAPIEKLKSHGFDSGVALFGKTVFTLVPSQEIACATSCLREFNGTLIVANVDSTGAKVLHSHT